MLRRFIDTTFKNNKEALLSEQVHELQPYKTKFMNMELRLKESETEVEALKRERNLLIEFLYEANNESNFNKANLKKSLAAQKNLEAKFSYMKVTLWKYCPNTLKEISKLFSHKI